MSLFNVGGLASGLDTNGIVDALVEAKSYRLYSYQDEQLKITYQQQAFQEVNINLLSLQAATGRLTDPDLYSAFAVTSSNESVATATASDLAGESSYSLEVTQLATATNLTSNIFMRSSGSVSSGGGIDTAQSFAAAGFASTPDGTATFTMADGSEKTFDLSSYATVQDFMDAVNNDTDIDIQLDYRAGTDDFLIRSTSGQNFSLSETGTTGFFTAAGMQPMAVSSDEVSTTSIDVTKSFADAGFDNEIDGTVSFNGVTFDPNAFATVQDFMDAVNNDAEANVTITYDNMADEFTIKGDSPSAGINLSESGTNGFLTEAKLSPDYSFAADPTKNMESQNGKFIEDITDSVFRINGVEFEVDASVDSINDIIKEINASDAGVTAMYDYSSRTFNFSANEEGDRSISFTEVSGNFLSGTGIYDASDDAAGIENRGLDAEFKLNGTAMTRSSNSFSVGGLDVTINDTGFSSINISQDIESAVSAVSSFIETYNSTLDYLDSVMNEESVADADTEAEMMMGILNSDAVIMNMDSSIQSMLTGQVQEYNADTGVMEMLGSLESIGISGGGSVEMTISGHLQFDEATFRQALKDDPEKVSKIFTKDYMTVVDEVPQGIMDGSNTSFSLDHDNLSFTDNQKVQVKLNGTALTQVFDRSKTLSSGEFRVDYYTGALELGDAPAASDDLTVTYAYTKDSGETSGALARLANLLDSYTEVNTGEIDSTVSSLQQNLDDIAERIAREELRIESYRTSQLLIYTNLETSISEMNSQADYLAAQISGSSSS
jgi:flagellar hook-associated protein 2